MEPKCAIIARSSTHYWAIHARACKAKRVHNSHMGIEWLEERRKELDLSHEQIGDAIGRERSVASKIMRGKSGFTPNDIPRLAAALKVSPFDLLVSIGVLEGKSCYEHPEFITINEEHLVAVLEAALEGVSDIRVSRSWIQRIVGVARRASERARLDDRLAGNTSLVKGWAIAKIAEENPLPPPEA